MLSDSLKELCIGIERRRAYNKDSQPFDGENGESVNATDLEGPTILYLVERERLASSSRYFKSMFQFPGKESAEGIFTLDFTHDFDGRALKSHILYSDSSYGVAGSFIDVWDSVPFFRLFLREIHGKNYYISTSYDDHFSSHFVTQ